MRKGGGQPQIGNFVNQRRTSGISNSGGGVPDGLQCQVCHKMKSKENYAKRQLQKYNPYNKSFTRNPSSVKVTCKTCTPGQTTELHCYICDTTYGLEKFGKNQRKDPDKARCTKCVDKILETEPDMSPPDTDEEDEGEDTDNETWTSGKKENTNPASKVSRSNTALSTHFGSSVSPNTRDTAALVTRSHSYAGSVASSVATSHATLTSHISPAQSRISFPAPSAVSRTASDKDIWETVPAAGPLITKSGSSAWSGPVVARSNPGSSSHGSRSTSRVAPLDMKSNGWAKVAKVPKGKEQRWGENDSDEGGVDQWAKYGRDIRDAKAGKASKKKKPSDSDSDDGEWSK